MFQTFQCTPISPFYTNKELCCKAPRTSEKYAVRLANRAIDVRYMAAYNLQRCLAKHTQSCCVARRLHSAGR